MGFGVNFKFLKKCFNVNYTSLRLSKRKKSLELFKFPDWIKAVACVFCFIHVLCPFCVVIGTQVRSVSPRTVLGLATQAKVKVFSQCEYWVMCFLA